MELRQLEHFVTTADFGSTRRAAETLYTSQSSVSKNISMLEEELGVTLFVRSNRGVSLTEAGREFYDQAHAILQNVRLMKQMGRQKKYKKINISCYPSTMISRLFCFLYNTINHDEYKMSFLEGTVEDIVDNVHTGVSDIGIVYFSKDQHKCFSHVLAHKDIEFIEISQHEPCIYVGPKNPLYDRESISFSDLDDNSFIQPVNDFFSIEHHLDRISVGMSKAANFKSLFSTNSDNQIIEMLLHTDICSFGIRLMNDSFRKYAIRDIPIDGCGKCLSFGYINKRNTTLSTENETFLELVKKYLCDPQNKKTTA